MWVPLTMGFGVGIHSTHRPGRAALFVRVRRAVALPAPRRWNGTVDSLEHSPRARRPPGSPDRISGHSLRVGSAQSLAAAGAGLVELQQAGDWKAPQMPAPLRTTPARKTPQNRSSRAKRLVAVPVRGTVAGPMSMDDRMNRREGATPPAGVSYVVRTTSTI